MKRIVWILGLIVGLAFCATTPVYADDIPTLQLSLNGVTLETIHAGTKDIKYPGNDLQITDSIGQVFQYQNVEIKGRGNTTWWQPKRPYQIKFDQKTDLFGLGASKKWVLLADTLDDSHIRNSLAFHTANLLDMPYTNQGQYVNLYIDGQYLGLYLLCHKTEIGKSTVNLKNDLGILVEMDNLWEPDDEFFVSNYGKHQILMKDTVSDSEKKQAEALEDFRQAYNRFERALYANNWEAIKQEIDVQSFVNYYILYEYSIDIDGLASSFYMYKDGPDDIIHAGPAWDYDLAFSNFRWVTDDLRNMSPYLSWTQRTIRKAEDSWKDNEICMRLMDHPEFRNLYKQTFQEKLYANKAEIDDFIQGTESYIMNVANYDNYIWGRNDFHLSAEYLREWSNQRLDYMNLLYGINNATVSGTYRVASYDSDLNQSIFNDYFYFQPQKDGSYKIIDVRTGRALNADDTSDDSPVNFARSLNIDAQHWYVTHFEGSQNYIIAKTSGLMLTAKDGQLVLQAFTNQENQTFNLFYRMQALIKADNKTYYQIVPANNQAYAAQSTFTQNQLTPKNSLNTSNYLLIRNFDSSYKIIDPLSRASKDIIIQENSTGTLKIIDSKKLQALSFNGKKLELADAAEDSNQEWVLVENKIPQLSNPSIIIKP